MLAGIWGCSNNENPKIRHEITEVTDHLEKEMANNPLAIGLPQAAGIRRVVRPPLATLYKVQEADRIAKVLWVKLWDE
jgi:hypothetical protein